MAIQNGGFRMLKFFTALLLSKDDIVIANTVKPSWISSNFTSRIFSTKCTKHNSISFRHYEFGDILEDKVTEFFWKIPISWRIAGLVF